MKNKEMVYRELLNGMIVKEGVFGDWVSLETAAQHVEQQAQFIDGIKFDTVQLLIDGKVYSEFEA